MKMLTIDGEAVSAGSKSLKEFLKCLLSFIQKKYYVDEQVFNVSVTDLLYKNFGK